MMTNIQSLDIHCPVLDDPAPVSVVDLVGKRVGDLGDAVGPPHVSEEGEELSSGNRIQ